MSGEKSKVVAGLVIGMALGLAIAAGVAWYIVNKNPAEFANRGRAKPAPQVAAAPASAPVAATAPVVPEASGVPDTTQHLEFYRVLTDNKSDGAGRKNAAKPKPPTTTNAAQSTPASKERYFVQAGSFQNMDDAEKLKAKLAFTGFEAIIQTADIPDKGVWYRVRLGPYSGGDAGKTIASLRQNGIIATQVRAQ